MRRQGEAATMGKRDTKPKHATGMGVDDAEARAAFAQHDLEAWLLDPTPPGLYTWCGDRWMPTDALTPQPNQPRAAVSPATAPIAELLTIAETARMLRMSDRNLRRLIARGRIKAMRARQTGSSRVLIPREEIERYLRSLRAE